MTDPLDRLHDREQRDAVVFYPPKAGREAEAARSWKRIGVCPHCQRRAIAGGRCIQCGADPRKGLPS